MQLEIKDLKNFNDSKEVRTTDALLKAKSES